MAHRILLCGCNLSEGQIATERHEDRVIAETVRPSRRIDDRALDRALDNARIAIGQGNGGSTVEGATPAIRRDVGELPEEKLEAAKAGLEASRRELAGWLAGLRPDFADYRLELVRLADKEATKAAAEVPFERDRVSKKRRELAGKASAWMAEAAAMGKRLVAAWDDVLPAADREKLAAVAPKTMLWKGDRFVSWSLTTIGACLVLGLFVKFNAMGGALFLTTVVASQPFWVPGAQATYDQWVELAALVAIAALPAGGWSGLDYFLQPWLSAHCPLSGACCSTAPPRGS